MIELSEILICPECYNKLRFFNEKFVCTACNNSYMINNGKPIFAKIETVSNSINSSKKNRLKNAFKKLYLMLPNNSIARLTLDRILKPLLKHVSGNIIIDIGAKNSPYRKLFFGKNYYCTDIELNNTVDFVSDIYRLPIQNNCVDCVICTEVLEHLAKPQDAIDSIYRILTPGGTCILTTRFLFPYHADPNDYYRYTGQGLQYLFTNYSNIKIFGHGNACHLIIYIITRPKILRVLLYPLIFLFSFISYKGKSNFSFGYIVLARK